jgi:hypothetical protein
LPFQTHRSSCAQYQMLLWKIPVNSTKITWHRNSAVNQTCI